jgi:hypothetical protein
MGRGLSDLQATILRLALANRETEGRGDSSPGADVLRAEVLAAYHGWDGHAMRYGAGYGDSAGSRDYGSQHFSEGRIGAGHYNAAHAALTRAFARLEARGLVLLVSGTSSRWSGAVLTPLGVEQARKLKVKTAVNLREP